MSDLRYVKDLLIKEKELTEQLKKEIVTLKQNVKNLEYQIEEDSYGEDL